MKKTLLAFISILFIGNISFSKDDPNLEIKIQIAKEEGAIKVLKEQLDEQVTKNGDVVAELPYEFLRIFTAGALTVGAGYVFNLGQVTKSKSLIRTGWVGIPIFGVTTFVTGFQITESFIVFRMTRSEAKRLLTTIDVRLEELEILKESLD